MSTTVYRIECPTCHGGPWACSMSRGCGGQRPLDLGYMSSDYGFMRHNILVDAVQMHGPTVGGEPYPYWSAVTSDWRGWNSPGGRIAPPYDDPGLNRSSGPDEACAMISLRHLADIFFDHTARLTSIGFELRAHTLDSSHVQVSRYTGQALYRYDAVFHTQVLGPPSLLTHHHNPGTALVPYR